MDDDKDIARLKSIFIAMARIEEYTHGLKEKDFRKDYKTVDAVIRCLVSIGINTEKLSDSFKSKYENIVWIDLVLFGQMAQFVESQIWYLIKDKRLGILNYATKLNSILSGFNSEKTPVQSLDQMFGLSQLIKILQAKEFAFINQFIKEINIHYKTELRTEIINIDNLKEVWQIYDENLILTEGNKRNIKLILTNEQGGMRRQFTLSDLLLGIELIAKIHNGENNFKDINHNKFIFNFANESIKRKNLCTDYKFPVKSTSSIWTVRKR